MTKPIYCNFCNETAVKPSDTCTDCGRPVCLDCTGDVDGHGRTCQPCIGDLVRFTEANPRPARRDTHTGRLLRVQPTSTGNERYRLEVPATATTAAGGLYCYSNEGTLEKVGP